MCLLGRDPKLCKQNRIISVYRVKIDECKRLWVLDTGKYGPSQTCDPQILAFDLKTDKLLYKIKIPKDMYSDASIFVTPTLDVRNPKEKCTDTFLYLADCGAFNIVVYDVKNNQFWKVNHRSMYPMPEWGTYNIQGDSFDLMDGVLGMDIEPYKQGFDRKLFYHSMSSVMESWVYTSQLRNKTRFASSPNSSPEIFTIMKSYRPSQAGAEAIDKNGIMYFGLMTETSLNCWNSRNSDYGKYIDNVVTNTVKLQFASGVKILTNKNNVEELLILTSRFQKIATASLNINENNFRIFSTEASQFARGKRCNYPESV